MLDIEKAIENEQANGRCIGPEHRRHRCSQCAIGDDAWSVWCGFVLSQLRETGTDPSELLDHSGRISTENKRLIDDILENGGPVTVRSINAAAATHVQRTKAVAEAARQKAFEEALEAARWSNRIKRAAKRFVVIVKSQRW
jgi:hypothetical protein